MNKIGTEFDRGDLAREIAGRYADQMAGSPEDIATIVLKGLGNVLPDALSQFGRIELHGIGTFHLERRAPRKGRDFKTGEQVEIPERQKVIFDASLFVSEVIEQRTGVPTY